MTVVEQSVVEHARAVAEDAISRFLAIHGDGAVVLSAVAGAGKSTFISDSVGGLRAEGMRVAVSAPTNEQVFSLVRSIATANPTETVTFLPATDVELPAWAALKNVRSIRPAHRASGAKLLVGTIDKLASARNPRRRDTPVLAPVDALLVDESYQADASRYYAVGDLARTHLLVGDAGQIDPFSTVTAGRQWRGLPEDPLQTAVGILLANHPTTPRLRFPITWRLDRRAAEVARVFYPPDHEFRAAIADGARELALERRRRTAAHDTIIDEVLDLAVDSGWAHLELPATEVLVSDPETVDVIGAIVSRLVARAPIVRCEREPEWQPLAPTRVAVGVSHNDQKDLVRARLDGLGLSDVVVGTANKLQGLEFDVMVCWHPLAGQLEADEFHVDSGRLCVLTTRHRHACIVVGRAGDRELVEGLPPSTPAWPGLDDAVLSGWDVHRAFFDALADVRVGLAEA